MEIRNRMAAVVLVSALVFAAAPVVAASNGADGGVVNCADYGNLVPQGATVDANLEVTVHGTICTIEGTVAGNVTVSDFTAECAERRPPFTAVNVVGGTIKGNVTSTGNFCTMVWLRDGASIAGNVAYGARGNLGFLGNGPGATVDGNVYLSGGLLWATGAATTNRVDGNIVCDGGSPLGGLGSGSATDWDGVGGDFDGTMDGVGGDLDGTIGGHYRC